MQLHNLDSCALECIHTPRAVYQNAGSRPHMLKEEGLGTRPQPDTVPRGVAVKRTKTEELDRIG